MFVVAKLRDRHAFHELHDEVRPPAVGCPRVQHFRNVRMVHHRHRLPLRLEASDDLTRVHSWLNDLERDGALDWHGLLGHEDNAHSAFADLLQKLVGSDDGAWSLGYAVGDSAIDSV